MEITSEFCVKVESPDSNKVKWVAVNNSATGLKMRVVASSNGTKTYTVKQIRNLAQRNEDPDAAQLFEDVLAFVEAM